MNYIPILPYVKELLQSCPVISLEDIQTDNANESEMLYSISPEPTNSIVKRYFGESKMQFVFDLFCFKQSATDELRDQNYYNYESLSDWFHKISKNRELPTMGDLMVPIRIEAIGSPYEHYKSEDGESALYGIQCAFYYMKKEI